MDEETNAKMAMWRRYLTRRQFLMLKLLAIAVILLSVIHQITRNTGRRSPPFISDRPLITVDTSDGRRLGNVIFSYASMLGIAMTNNMTAIMPKSFMLNKIFKLKVTLVDEIDGSLGKHEIYGEYGRRGSAYDFNTRHMKRVNTKLMGYYQSWMYYENMDMQIREHLQFQDHVVERAKEFLGENQSQVRVGLHIRRGDMLDDYYRNYGYLTPPADYYIIAMNYFKTRFHRVKFYVCSDDIRWAESNIKGENVVFSKGRTESEDMCILSLCDHTIVSVGSFGWWGGFLAGGITVYYDKWPKEYSKLEYHVDKRTYFPPDWIPLH